MTFLTEIAYCNFYLSIEKMRLPALLNDKDLLNYPLSFHQNEKWISSNRKFKTLKAVLNWTALLTQQS